MTIDNDSDHAPLTNAELVTEIIMALVSSPEKVHITVRELPDMQELTIHAADSDLGKIIGKSGDTISIVRKLLGRIAASKGEKISIQVSEPNRSKRPFDRRGAAA